MRPYLRIEPARHVTYSQEGMVAVFRYDVYPPDSVLAGRERRTFLDDGEVVEDLHDEYPEAEIDPGCWAWLGVKPPRPVWNEVGEVGESIYFTMNDGRIVGMPTARRRAVAALRAQYRGLVNLDDFVAKWIGRTLNTPRWISGRSGMLVAAIARDVATEAMLAADGQVSAGMRATGR